MFSTRRPELMVLHITVFKAAATDLLDIWAHEFDVWVNCIAVLVVVEELIDVLFADVIDYETGVSHLDDLSASL